VAGQVSITHLDGLNNLTSLARGLYIGNNDALTNLDGLSNLTSVGDGLVIHRNNSLQNLYGLSSITYVGGHLGIKRNSLLTNLDGLASITSVGGSLSISMNDSLTNLCGLSNITSVGDYLAVRGNSLLTNIDDLSNLTSVGSDLFIDSNVLLTNLYGLSNIMYVGGSLEVKSNAVLNIFCELYPLLSSNGLQGSYTVADNLTNPTQQQIIDDGPCVTSIENELLPEDYHLLQNFPNPFNPTTTIMYCLPEAGTVSLTIYNIRGQEVTTAQEASKPPGTYEVQWNGMDRIGRQVSTGVYFARLQAGEYNQTIKMLYLR
jgi:hypothetical protein